MTLMIREEAQTLSAAEFAASLEGARMQSISIPCLMAKLAPR